MRIPRISPLLFAAFGFLFSTPALTAEKSPGPLGIIKEADLQRARTHLEQSDWARNYLKALKDEVDPWKEKFTPAFLENFIPQTTPGDHYYTPCPSCREQKRAYLPHGDWEWLPESPDELLCKGCKLKFPNEKYPESVAIHTTWGKPQTFTFAGGEPFPIFTYPQGRPSFTGSIRARKVDWISSLSRKIAEIYALTGEPAYAEATHAILLRLAEVYPYWLVHSGYGDYADMEPAVAARHINALPKDETVYPPNRPVRQLHRGYWSAGRARGVGIEGIFVTHITTAYDLTRHASRTDGSPLYTKDERTTIEQNLLKESTILLVADKVINNASMANRSAAGLVGIVLGDPELVRFGIEGFYKTVDEWFLPDGGTPESPSYAIMALGGIVEFTQALRGYSDPAGYTDSEGKRYDNFDPYAHDSYRNVWAGMFHTLQGDLHYPPIADTHPNSSMSEWFAEIMADNYPENKTYLSLLYERLGKDWNRVHAPSALYYAPPERSSITPPPLVFPDHIFPALKIGFMRTGTDGRESLLLLSASDWGIHHQFDSLNLYYWKNGQELWSDLGYLWDNPNHKYINRTFAHNTVVIDSENQIFSKRIGTVHYFLSSDHVKGMSASSNAYASATTYQRSVTLVDHGQGNSYTLDLFYVQGGTTQDYVYHGPNNDWTFHPAFSSTTLKLSPSSAPLYDLTNVQEIPTPTGPAPAYRLTWGLPHAREFSVWNLPQPQEKSHIGSGWGQRSFRNYDLGHTLPYIVRRTKGAKLHTFVSLLEEHYAGSPFIRSVTPLPIAGANPTARAFQIETAESRDYIILNHPASPLTLTLPDGQITTTAALTVLSMSEGAVQFSSTDSGEHTFTPSKNLGSRD